jgi:hypothetical protein
MIAHRLGTLEHCDIRLSLEAGRIARRGRARARGGTGDVAGHPATVAWRTLGGAAPRAVTVLKARRFRKRGVYCLDGAGRGGEPVIAKICKRSVAEVESTVYEELLPRLAMPMLRYHGMVPDEDKQHCWLFLEDAGTERYSVADADHRRLAARWLAEIQLHAGEIVARLDLPDRGPRHYLVQLYTARDEIGRQLRRRHADPRAAPVFQSVAAKLDELESSWDDVAGFCDQVPRTFVHGDLVPKNLRIVSPGARPGLAIFDWETAGIGPQAPDLAQLLDSERSALARPAGRRPKHVERFSAHPCLATYHDVLGRAAPDLDVIARSAAIGSVFRCVAGISWACEQSTSVWSPIDDFEIYDGWLGNALREALESSSSSMRVAG